MKCSSEDAKLQPTCRRRFSTAFRTQVNQRAAEKQGNLDFHTDKLFALEDILNKMKNKQIRDENQGVRDGVAFTWRLKYSTFYPADSAL